MAPRIVRYEDEVSGDEFPHAEVFDRTQWIDFKPLVSFRIHEEAKDSERTTVEIWAIGDRTKSVLAEVTFKSQRINSSSQEPRVGRYLIVAGSQAVAVRALADRPAGEVLGPLVTALETSAAEDRDDLEALLFGLCGSRPDGAVALSDESSADDVKETLEAWRGWWETGGRDWVWKYE